MKKKSYLIDLSALTVTNQTGGLEIELKWRSFVYILALILGVVAVTVMISTQWKTLTFTGFTFLEKPFAIVICAVAFALLAFTYYCLARFFNKTRIVISDHLMTITHGPLPWHLNTVLSLSDIRLFEVKVRREKTRQGQGPPFYRIEALLHSGKWKMITPYHEDEDLIREIERLIRDQVKIG
ncbi:MAG: hypothetical protein J0L62_13125 [Bacteroidetes bacterium]|nr:hypothetical protein [Bacteroidota bacterium]